MSIFIINNEVNEGNLKKIQLNQLKNDFLNILN